ncbi:GNAT family N-acetyltransferase [Streptomyces sp. HC307]|uniref:GNAT family N-acetyltransferase n=1 Tax=Streptomyces flavusporus TaxID=3385496 RepID=UPI003917637F
MPPTDASADAGAAPVTDRDPGAGASTGKPADADGEDTLDLSLPAELISLLAMERTDADRGEARGMARHTAVTTALRDDLLDHVDDWGPTDTPAGVFQLVPVRVERDLPLVGRWMNDPAVAAFWELAGPPNVTEDHLCSQLAGDGRSVPCLGVLDGTPMSYWEIYRADLDSLARYYPARPHDTGIHLLIGDVADRGQGIGRMLLRAVADLVLVKRPACARVVAEPDIRNTPSVAAFLSAGFRFAAEMDLPAKRAALMVRDRSLRDLL